jgi:hypothetical protein
MSKSPKLQTVYHNMEFPQYEYHEFPKWVKHPVDGKLHLVHDEREEGTILAAKPLIRDEDERARLIKVAEIKGVTVDKRWNAEKLSRAITDAGFDAALNPYE